VGITVGGALRRKGVGVLEEKTGLDF